MAALRNEQALPRPCSDHHVTHETRGDFSFVAIGVRLVTGEHVELPRRNSVGHITEHQRQAAFKHIELFAPAIGIGFGRVVLARFQAPFPELHLAGGTGLGQQHRLAARNGAGPGQFIDATRIAGLGSLDQVAEGYVECFGHAIEGGQADVLFTRLDRHQHPPADPGLFSEGRLAHIGGVAQAPNIEADVLQDRGPLRGIFVHYIAHLVGLGSILRNIRRIVRPPQVARKVMTSVNSSHNTSPRFSRFSKAECVLVLITMVWGGTFLLVQHAMTVSGPMFFVGLRFAAATLIVALFSWRHLRDLTLFELKAGSFIGVAIMLGYGLQTVGLQSIPSSQSAFITALYVPFVPLLQWLVLGRRPGLMPSIGIMLAFTGLMLLSGPAGASLNFSPGEIATLISAVAIAAEIILISNFAGQVDVRRVTVVQLAVTSVLSFLLVVPTQERIPDFSWLLLCSALGLGAASAAIQVAMNWAQKSVSPTRATLIYAGEPVWAGIVGRIAGERLPAVALVGAGLIVAAVIVSELKTKGKGVVAKADLESETQR
jgi:drug/metabolite transporter (DMT)-like permease